jgi:RNA ligase
MAVIDLQAFREHEAQGLITGRIHPTHDLIIWNYTPDCQYSCMWNNVTMQARGLITKPDGTIVARPLKKFFGWDEYKRYQEAFASQAPSWCQEVPYSKSFTVTSKEDGYLGILYQVDGKPYISTRGSFTSEMAIRANKILEKYKTYSFDPQYTYLFEIIYPQGRIVVSYDDMEDLILLAVVETESGNEIDIHEREWPFPVVQSFDGISDCQEPPAKARGLPLTLPKKRRDDRPLDWATHSRKHCPHEHESRGTSLECCKKH